MHQAVMPTYSEIQAFIKERHRRVVKTCHIAHVKSDLGLPMRDRKSNSPRKYPCPDAYRGWIEEAFRVLSDL